MAKIGYALINTDDSIIEEEVTKLKEDGCEEIVYEKIIPVRFKRPKLMNLINQLQSGDTLVIYELDRIGYSVQHICKIIHELRTKNVVLRSIKEGVDSSTPIGEVFCNIADIFSEIEDNHKNESIKSTIATNKEKGTQIGRPSPLKDKTVISKIRELRESGLSVKDISKKLNIPTSTLYRYLKLI